MNHPACQAAGGAEGESIFIIRGVPRLIAPEGNIKTRALSDGLMNFYKSTNTTEE